MATADDKTGGAGRLSVQAQRSVISYLEKALEKRQQFTELFNKMDAIDVAYARYKESQKDLEATSGQDIRNIANVGCDVFAADDVVPPIVVSQVDTYVAYLAEVFLSGTPLFPVVSSAKNRKWAETLEAVIDDHSILGGYHRQLLLFLRDCCKYNFAALEVEWDSIDQFTVLADIASATGQSVKRKPKKFSRVTRINPRNVIWDWSLAPGDVAEQGDYAGYIKRMSRTKLKRLLNKLTNERKLYNGEKAMLCGQNNTTFGSNDYKEDPIISKYITAPLSSRNAAPNWDAWFDPQSNKKRGPPAMDAAYEVAFLYGRIMPADMGIMAPQPNTPQIWKFIVVNKQVMVSAERVISAYDALPILFGQPLEDGLGYQTQSIAEGEIPFQEAANTLFNIRFAAARRAVSDRALYLPDMIKPSDINSKVPAPKIPVAISPMSQKGLGDAYMQIPFDMRGTETTIQDASLIVQFSQQLHGINKPRQGEFQKGNKSVQEWNDTMGGSDGRMRLPALTLECQVFSPLKSIIGLNILQNGEDGVVTSQATGKEIDVKIAELRKAALSFRMADGYTPKSKIASTEVLLAGMTMIGNSEILQQSFGPALPNIFAHFMSLSGVKGFDEYMPENQQQAAVQPPGLAGNDLRNEIPVNNEPTA